MNTWGKLLAAVGVAALSGCASSLVGYSAETEHTCPRTEGVGCTPVSEVYKRAMAGTLPGQVTSPSSAASAGIAQRAPDANVSTAALRPVMSSGIPVRTAPRVLRIWFAPWKDALDVLHDQRHSYLTLDNGRWLIEHNQQQLFQQFSATRLIQGPTGESADPKALKQPALGGAKRELPAAPRVELPPLPSSGPGGQ